jgi:hypothetical protein
LAEKVFIFKSLEVRAAKSNSLLFKGFRRQGKRRPRLGPAEAGKPTSAVLARQVRDAALQYERRTKRGAVV